MNKSKIVFLRDKDWSLIDGDLCLATEFAPLLGCVVRDGAVISNDTTTPYASINLRCQKTSKKITGFITHKIDFANLWAAFRERGIKEEKEEVLIYWSTKRCKYKILQILSAISLTIFGITPFPKIIVMICPKGTYKNCETYSDGFSLASNKDSRVFIYGLMSIKWWMPEVFK